MVPTQTAAAVAQVRLRRERRVAARGADVEHADFLRVDESLAREELAHGALDVLDALRRVFERAWLPFRFALVGGVVGEADEARLGEHTSVVCE
jgi:hypothetical protein